ncbi:MAG: hypothetical protein MO853_10035 [Candidatus Protistobacter heckmanni]|nr:hypothetical protein [Candidatus Protistobacter heckmanni]
MSDHDLPKPVAALMAEQAANLKFLAHSSHEIRTPLSSVIGFADLLAEGGVENEEQGRMLAIVSQEAHRLAKVFEQVFRLARLDAGRGTEWNWKAWPAQALFAHVGARAVPETMTLPDIVERGWIEGLTVVCDGDALAAACAALFDNAQRYAGAHAAVSLIAERAELEGRPALRLTVQDTARA